MIQGLRLLESVVRPEEQDALVAQIEATEPAWEHPVLRPGLPAARRAMVCYGWNYSTLKRTLERGAPIPAGLVELRDRCARIAGLAAESFEQVIVTRYYPGAGIDWHTDAPAFGPTIMVLSLLTDWRVEFDREGPATRVRLSLPQGSLLVLSGPARSDWRHRIPPVKRLRWSISFRSRAR